MSQSFEDIKSDEKKYLMQTYSRFDVALDHGSGAAAVGVDGKRYIDFGSGIGVNSLGYADKKWVAAVCGQAKKLAHISNLYYSPVQIELAKMLCGISGFGRVFFCNSGAEANEGMIKLARKYSFDKYGNGRNKIVTLKNSFHGRTVTTLSATGQDKFHDFFFPFTEGFAFTQPNDSASLEKALGDDVCAIMLEAVQGEGGVYPLEKEFVKRAAELSKERDILLLFDEVQAGIGRTGRLFAFENFGVKADAVSSAKGLAGGLPFGAVLCSNKLGNVLGPGTHGTTFGGNPMACAGAIEVLKRIGEPGFMESVSQKGEYIRAKLGEMPEVKNIRGLGLMLAFDIEGAESSKAAAELVRRGLLILTAKSSLRMLPPLVITKEEIDEGLEIIKNYISDMK